MAKRKTTQVDGGHDFTDKGYCSVCWLSKEFVMSGHYACPGQRAAGEQFSPGPVQEHDHGDGWHHFPVQTLVEAGLLQRINRDFLWPLGLALNVTVPGSEEAGRDYRSAVLCVVEPTPLDDIVSAGVDRTEGYANFVDQRLSAIARVKVHGQ